MCRRAAVLELWLEAAAVTGDDGGGGSGGAVARVPRHLAEDHRVHVAVLLGEGSVGNGGGGCNGGGGRCCHGSVGQAVL